MAAMGLRISLRAIVSLIIRSRHMLVAFELLVIGLALLWDCQYWQEDGVG